MTLREYLIDGIDWLATTIPKTIAWFQDLACKLQFVDQYQLFNLDYGYCAETFHTLGYPKKLDWLDFTLGQGFLVGLVFWLFYSIFLGEDAIWRRTPKDDSKYP